MGTKKEAGFRSYAAAPIMIVTGFTIASLVFTFILKEPSPVPVFIIFAIIQGGSMSLYALLRGKAKTRVRMVSMFLIGSFLMGLVGIASRNNLQIEGFLFYLFSGSVSGVIVHFMMAKILGPLFFSRNWCSWGCWTAMILDLLPYKDPGAGRQRGLGAKARYVYLGMAVVATIALYFGFNYNFVQTDAEALAAGMGTMNELIWFIAGNVLYYVIGITLAFKLKDNRAFCKYVCPVSVFFKVSSRFTILRIKGNAKACTNCNSCVKKCPMGIDIPSYIKADRRVTSMECIMCLNCIPACPKGVLKASAGIDPLVKSVKSEQAERANVPSVEKA